MKVRYAKITSIMFTPIFQKNLRENIKGNKIWISIGETTDVDGRYVANVMIGTLETNQPGKVYMLNTEILDEANYSIVTKLFDRSIARTVFVTMTYLYFLVTPLRMC